jgi:hypothetical protein
MDEKTPHYVVCRNGVFFLPDELVQTLSVHCRGHVYFREDEDVLTISSSQVRGGRGRPLTPRFRAAMFRDATRLAIVDLNDSLQVMGVAWRK